MFVSITWFVRIYLNAGRLWLAWTITGLRTVYLLLTFAAGLNVNYQTVAPPRHIQFLGESISVLGGVPNPLMAFGQFGVLLILVFTVDASVTAWRRGDRRKAVTVGGSVDFFILAGLATVSVVIWGNVQAPIVISHCYLGLVLVMGYEMSRDVLRASQLVHDLQASEAGLRESEARMSLAVEAGDFGIWVWDLARNEIWASDSWRALFGIAPAEPLTVDGVMRRVHPDDRDTLRQTQASAIAGANGGRYETEYRVLMPDDTTRWISSRARVEVDAGRPIRIRGASREVTGRKLAEEEALLLRQEIAHAGRVSMMGQLASGLAHEINQPLASILRNAEAAELFLRDPSPDLDEIRAILSDIRADDERAGQVIERMRSLLKRQTLDARCLDVGSLVGDVAALVRVDAASRQVKLDMEVPGGLPLVHGDRVHLQQVLLNLVLNGMDALNGANPGAASSQHDGAAERGTDDRDRRGRRRPGNPRRHAGAGLRPVRHHQAAWDGHGPGDFPNDRRGTRRTDLGGKQGGRRGRVPVHAADRRGGCRIMTGIQPTVHIVDDNAPFLAATSRLLRASGFAVQTFASAADFLTQRHENAPGCVLADVQMPGMNGLELQAALARSTNPLPILFLTGHGDIPSSVRAMRDGAEDFLEKRAPKEQLLAAIERAMARDVREREALARQRELRARFDALTKRELEVLGYVVRGKLNKQIAGDLGIHERTVKLHRAAITTKLHVQSVAELTRLTDEAGVCATSASN